jgi:hypothetical protein
MKLNLYIWLTALPGIVHGSSDNDYSIVAASNKQEAVRLAQKEYLSDESLGRETDSGYFGDYCSLIGACLVDGDARVISTGSCSTK